MQIEHVAIWTRDLERLRVFYERYFGARAGERYENAATGFTSYFLTFASGTRLELMQLDSIADALAAQTIGSPTWPSRSAPSRASTA